MSKPSDSFKLHDWLIRSNAPDEVWTAYYALLQDVSKKHIKVICLDEKPNEQQRLFGN